MYTGLEPYTLYCRWYPSAKCYPARRVEGFSLLRKLPHTDEETLPAVAFVEGSVAAIKSTMQEIFRTYLSSNAPQVRAEWTDWSNKHVPEDENVSTYLEQLARFGLPYDIPMRTLYLDSSQTIVQPRWNISEQPSNTNATDFEWPPDLAAAMNSVTCDYNLHPPAPRFYAANGPELLERVQKFREKSVPYYNHVNSLTMVPIKNIFKRKISVSGIAPATSTGNRYYFVVSFIVVFI
jgi:hypothetical protein